MSEGDRDGLHRVADSGSDMSKSMVIDFFFDAPSEATARLCLRELIKQGERADVFAHGRNERWTVEVKRTLIATYEALADAQSELKTITAAFDCHPDGWGTFGNAPDNQPGA